jgi:hypothetical protein
VVRSTSTWSTTCSVSSTASCCEILLRESFYGKLWGKWDNAFLSSFHFSLSFFHLQFYQFVEHGCDPLLQISPRQSFHAKWSKSISYKIFLNIAGSSWKLDSLTLHKHSRRQPLTFQSDVSTKRSASNPHRQTLYRNLEFLSVTSKSSQSKLEDSNVRSLTTRSNSANRNQTGIQFPWHDASLKK